MRVAILDDYQRVARGLADWDRLPAGSELAVLDRHVADREELVRTLEPFDVLVAMRERTPLPGATCSTGCRACGCWSPPACATPSIDLDAAAAAASPSAAPAAPGCRRPSSPGR